MPSSQTTTLKPSSPSSSSSNNPDNRREALEAALRWGKTPSSPTDEESGDDLKDKEDSLPPDHPVHKISPEKREKMRAKGVNPVLKAEMDEATRGQGKEKKFWSKYASTSLGWWTR